jgi:putative tryptophan/tyrosine transport system substrate-binding protein
VTIDISKRQLVAVLSGAAAWPLVGRAQQIDLRRQIGVLMPISEADPDGQAWVAAFRKELEGLGFIDGGNARILVRWAAGDLNQLHQLARELVDLRVDVILASTTPVVAALQHETLTVPIVFAQVADPVGQGLVSNMARPGANITGFTQFEFSMGGKCVEVLKELAPPVTHVALMFNPDTAPYAGSFLRSFETAAAALAVKPVVVAVHSTAEIEDAVSALGREPHAGLAVMPDVFSTLNRQLIASLAAQYRVPAICPYRYFVNSGGLISYGIDIIELYRGAASYVNRVLRGEKTAELPVQAPTHFELVINLKAAKAIDLTVPSAVLARADDVIE